MSIHHQLETQNKTINYDNIKYLINEEENTVEVIDFKRSLSKIIIPRSIKQGSKEYEVTSISEKAFYKSRLKIIQFASDSKLQTIGKYSFSYTEIKSITIPSSVTFIDEGCFLLCERLKEIKIPEDSKLQTIEKDAFFGTNIKSINIPSELIELKEGWCKSADKLTKIVINPKNPRYFCYENKMIIGKTNIEQNNYDCLVFCSRDIQHIKIPNFIEHIDPYSFEYCNQLESIEFSDDSKLQTIEKFAFSKTKIKRIKIPSSVTFIGEGAFNSCFCLEQIEIPDDSKLKTIEKNAFQITNIENFLIPSELIELKEGWCNSVRFKKISVSPKNPRYCCINEKIIIGKTKIEQSNYDCLVFCARDVKRVKIPNFIEHIDSCSFEYCNKLKSIEFSDDSKLQTIGNYAFVDVSIKKIRIPSSVTFFGEGAFRNCVNYEIIEIPEDSKLQTIEKDVFYGTNIESINIPSELIELKEGWCRCADKLTKIVVSPKNPRYFCYENKMIIGKTNIEQNNYDCLVFCSRDIQHIKIPNFIEHIYPYTFNRCNQLESIEFSDDSKLQTIEKFAFSGSSIKRIKIPSSVTFIKENAFSFCDFLKICEFSDDSKLQTIGNEAFLQSSITSISIPSSVMFIEEGGLNFSSELQIVEIYNLELILKDYEIVFVSSKPLFMIHVH